MKQAYFGISLSNRPQFDKEIACLKRVLKTNGIDLFVFVDQYQFSREQEKEMMQQAFADIDQSDWVIVEMSKKAVGVGIEAGYAYAHKKPIIYLKKKQAPYSTTTGGCARFFIEYEQLSELEAATRTVFNQLLI